MTIKEEFCASAHFGSEGPAGTPGKDGLTPFINAAGNWQLGDNDTGVKAAGKDGTPGTAGLTPFINAAGNWQIGGNDTGVKAAAKNGKDGAPGKDGLSASVDVAGTETLEPEEEAEVINQGTAQQAKLLFKIPRGARGEETTLRQPHYDTFADLAKAHPVGTVQEAYVVGPLNDVYIWDPVIHNWVSVGRLGWLPKEFEVFKNNTEIRLRDLADEIDLRLTQGQADGLYAPKATTYSKTEVEEKINEAAQTLAPQANTYTKEEVDNKVAQCAPQETTYTKTEVDELLENNQAEPYTLPPATADTLGGVKVGAGLNMDENGVLSAAQQQAASPAIDGQTLTEDSTSKALGLFGKKTLTGGNCMTIDEVPPEGGIDEHTKACWHFDKDALDAVAGQKMPSDNSFQNIKIHTLDKKLGEASASGFARFDYCNTGYSSFLVSAAAWNMNTANDFTVDFWVKPGSYLTQNDLRLAFLGGSSKIYVTFSVKNDNTLIVWPSTVSDAFSIANGYTFYSPADTSKSATVEIKHAWAHVAVTYNGTSKKMNVFVDGVKTLEADYAEAISTAYTFTHFGFFSTVDQSGSPALVDELRVSDNIRYEEDFAPASMPYCGDNENTGVFVLNWNKPEGEAADISKYLTNCVLEAPNGGVVSVPGKRWYDYWQSLTSSQKENRALVQTRTTNGVFKCKTTFSSEQVNGNWTIITKVKTVYTTTYRTQMTYFATVRGTRASNPGVSHLLAYIGLSTSSRSIPFYIRARIIPYTDSNYDITTNFTPQSDVWYWFKLQKTGNSYTLSYSTDEVNYTILGSKSDVPNIETILDNSGYLSVGGLWANEKNTSYIDLTSNEFNNLFLGTELTPLITYEETPDSIKANQGLKVLIPNEKNEDGTLKNITYVLENALTANVPTVNGRYLMALFQDGTLAFYKKEMLVVSHVFGSITTDKIWYSPKFNFFKMYEDGSWQIKYFVIIGEVRVENGIIKESNYNIPVNLNAPNMDFAPSNIDYVVETYSDASGNWYRVYKSGWIEQGGITPNQTSAPTITYLKAFADTNYSLLVTGKNNNSAYKNSYSSKTATGFVELQYQNNYGCEWYASGKGA